MAKYIKQEMPDIRQTGEKKIYYRLKTEKHVDFHHFIESVHHSNNGISKADAWYNNIPATKVDCLDGSVII